MAGLEKIGKLADDLRIDRIFKLAELEKFDDCITKVDWALKNFIRFKIKDKRQIKAKIQSVKEYCLLMTGKDRNNFLKNTPSSRRSPLNQPAPLDKTRPLPEKKPTQVPVVSLSPFREKFMKRGDPTDPQNQALLKELLGQVMIRNTSNVPQRKKTGPGKNDCQKICWPRQDHRQRLWNPP